MIKNIKNLFTEMPFTLGTTKKPKKALIRIFLFSLGFLFLGLFSGFLFFVPIGAKIVKEKIQFQSANLETIAENVSSTQNSPNAHTGVISFVANSVALTQQTKEKEIGQEADKHLRLVSGDSFFNFSKNKELLSELLQNAELTRSIKTTSFAENISEHFIFECALIPQNNSHKFNAFLKKMHTVINDPVITKYTDHLQTVGRYAKRYKLDPALIFAIMHIESNFKPRAVSPSNALGLMQIVPSSAGQEVHYYLTGVREEPHEKLLFSPESNIKYGTTYLHLLNSAHFKYIANPEVRKLCMIAAYNGGPNAVYRVFHQEKEKAIEMINALSESEAFERLTTEMPKRESREYISKVLDYYEFYAQEQRIQNSYAGLHDVALSQKSL